ncbi:MAG: FecR domain-containing protein [Actinobacteria bacterium]|nr:FecR domain-containing protein [Actinomycetota bacterium]MCG2817486.1 FecR domain-containing protein [Actinomycetes bacterium]MBU4217970.1 FecR domain-containing protein [Actinomycetota bacterium]MBU4357916.1 FecR domain-containing protein [Actinomycetota bacterium]MBU4393033.1 FecR domain-containing protein [Actinomycetota bacterium]
MNKEDMRNDLEELLGSTRHEGDVEGLAAAARTLSSAWPDPGPERVESVSDCRDRMLTLHLELFGPKEDASRHTRQRRYVIPLSVGAAVAALLTIVVFVGIVLMGRGGPTVAELRVQAGEVTVVSSNGKATGPVEQIDLRQGDTISTGEDGLCEILFDNGTVTRLDGSTDITLSFTHGIVADLELERGQCYSQAIENNVITVSALVAESTTIGGAMNVNMGDDSLETLAVRDGSLVACETADDVVIRDGLLASVYAGGAKSTLEVHEVTREELHFDWFRYNLAMDRREGFDPGILSELPDENLEDVLEEIVPPEELHQSEIPTGKTEANQQAVAESGTEDGEQATDPTPGDQEPEEPTDPEDPEVPVDPEDPAQQPSMTLEGQASTGRVRLTWSVSGADECTGYSVLRKETGGADPRHPGDIITNISGVATTSYNDTAVVQGRTYRYRLALTQDGALKAYSNVISVLVPEEAPPPSLSLSGSRGRGGEVNLSWALANLSGVTQWAVCRSTTTRTPVYPPNRGDDAWTMTYRGDSGSYTDGTASPGVTYYYRVTAVVNGAVALYSNSVTIGP